MEVVTLRYVNVHVQNCPYYVPRPAPAAAVATRPTEQITQGVVGGNLAFAGNLPQPVPMPAPTLTAGGGPVAAGNLLRPVPMFSMPAPTLAAGGDLADAGNLPQQTFEPPPWRRPSTPAPPPKSAAPAAPEAPEAAVAELPPPREPAAPQTPAAAVTTGFSATIIDALLAEVLQLTLHGAPDPIDLVLSDPSDDVSDHRIKLVQKARSQQDGLAAALMRFLTEHCDEEPHRDKLALVSQHVQLPLDDGVTC